MPNLDPDLRALQEVRDFAERAWRACEAVHGYSQEQIDRLTRVAWLANTLLVKHELEWEIDLLDWLNLRNYLEQAGIRKEDTLMGYNPDLDGKDEDF